MILHKDFDNTIEINKSDNTYWLNTFCHIMNRSIYKIIDQQIKLLESIKK